ncbi:MAG: hypothetical protein JHC33_09430 [Ignisphaera sp.]|nr:hypothetical protein [Ignisphaera sp.]
MAFTVGINKTMNNMMDDLETLMLGHGWTKELNPIVSSITTSRGLSYRGTAEVVPGKYSGTYGFRLSDAQSLTHEIYSTNAAPDTYFSPYPTEFSVSMWVNFKDYIDKNPDYTYDEGAVNVQPYLIQGLQYGTTTRRGFDLMMLKHYPLGLFRITTIPTLEALDLSGDPTGQTYFLLTHTYSNITRTLKIYINSTLAQTVIIPTSSYLATTMYPAIWRFYGIVNIAMTEIISWNKVLTPSDILTLVNRSTPVDSTEPYVFEKITNVINVQKGGYYSKVSKSGATIKVSIIQNTSNNIELNSYIFCNNESYPKDRTVTQVVGAGIPKYIAGVSGLTNISKYWLVVSDDYVSINYKLYDTTAVRSTPLYQSGLIGMLNTLGNEGNNIFIAGTTSTSTYLWTTINTTSLRSGFLYSPNNLYRLGYTGYITLVVGSVTAGLVNLKSISSNVFMASITGNYDNSMTGIIPGVYVVSSTQANTEDIITINAIDYVVLDDGDASPTNQYRLAIKLV